MDNLFLLIFFASIIALVVGLIKPTAFSRFIKREITRKRIGKIFGIATISSFLLFAITTDSSKNNEVPQQPAVEDTQAVAENKNGNPALVVEKTETTLTPAPTPMSSETVSQKNAVKKAKSYLAYTAFSYDGLIAQLEYEQFPHADAVYGADNSGANWNEQAAKKAKSYMEMSAYSRGSLIAQLEYEKFTQAQVEYGANAVGL